MTVKFLLAGHSEQQWNTLPQYQFYGTSKDADIGSWSPKGSAAAAVLFVMGKINSVQMNPAEMIQAIISQYQTMLYMAVEASLLVLHIHPEPDCSYIVDLESLGATAFESCETVSGAQKPASEAGQEQAEHQRGFMPSLRSILEDISIPKVLFDCRPACAFLAGRFGITMRSVEDIQCLEFAGRLVDQRAGGEASRDLRSCLE
ncbi:hypothetical protein SLS64_011753 [Diaporthe eres]